MTRRNVILALAAAVPVALIISLRLGAVDLGWMDLWLGLLGRGEPSDVAIIRDLRLPRSVLATVVGGALGLAGVAFQALLRNPLAEPYILGISSGAAVGAVLAFGFGWAATGWGLPSSAFAGALTAIVLVFAIATGAGRALDVRVLLLAGVVVGAFFNACILLALTFQEADAFRSAVFWMMGSLAGAGWRAVAWLSIALIVSGLGLFALARSLDLLAQGEETAAFAGVEIARVRILAYGLASLLTASTVVVAGGIGFVGLFVPHTARMLWGGEHRFLIPASILLGAAFLPIADTLARVVAAPAEVPIGVVTAFIGVPFFVALLRRQVAAPRP